MAIPSHDDEHRLPSSPTPRTSGVIAYEDPNLRQTTDRNSRDREMVRRLARLLGILFLVFGLVLIPSLLMSLEQRVGPAPTALMIGFGACLLFGIILSIAAATLSQATMAGVMLVLVVAVVAGMLMLLAAAGSFLSALTGYNSSAALVQSLAMLSFAVALGFLAYYAFRVVLVRGRTGGTFENVHGITSLLNEGDHAARLALFCGAASLLMGIPTAAIATRCLVLAMTPLPPVPVSAPPAALLQAFDGDVYDDKKGLSAPDRQAVIGGIDDALHITPDAHSGIDAALREIGVPLLEGVARPLTREGIKNLVLRKNPGIAKPREKRLTIGDVAFETQRLWFSGGITRYPPNPPESIQFSRDRVDQGIYTGRASMTLIGDWISVIRRSAPAQTSMTLGQALKLQEMVLQRRVYLPRRDAPNGALPAASPFTAERWLADGVLELAVDGEKRWITRGGTEWLKPPQEMAAIAVASAAAHARARVFPIAPFAVAAALMGSLAMIAAAASLIGLWLGRIRAARQRDLATAQLASSALFVAGWTVFLVLYFKSSAGNSKDLRILFDPFIFVLFLAVVSIIAFAGVIGPIALRRGGATAEPQH
jgi:hypothetical protein